MCAEFNKLKKMIVPSKSNSKEMIQFVQIGVDEVEWISLSKSENYLNKKVGTFKCGLICSEKLDCEGFHYHDATGIFTFHYVKE